MPKNPVPQAPHDPTPMTGICKRCGNERVEGQPWNRYPREEGKPELCHPCRLLLHKLRTPTEDDDYVMDWEAFLAYGKGEGEDCAT